MTAMHNARRCEEARLAELGECVTLWKLLNR
jgi:hypothetical protein